MRSSFSLNKILYKKKTQEIQDPNLTRKVTNEHRRREKREKKKKKRDNIRKSHKKRRREKVKKIKINK